VWVKERTNIALLAGQDYPHYAEKLRKQLKRKLRHKTPGGAGPSAKWRPALGRGPMKGCSDCEADCEDAQTILGLT
jgi:hypothetical protein